MSSNKCIQEHLNQSKKETLNPLPSTLVKIEDEDNSKCDNVFNDKLDIEISDDESSKPKSPVLITVTYNFVCHNFSLYIYVVFFRFEKSILELLSKTVKC